MVTIIYYSFRFTIFASILILIHFDLFVLFLFLDTTLHYIYLIYFENPPLVLSFYLFLVISTIYLLLQTNKITTNKIIYLLFFKKTNKRNEDISLEMKGVYIIGFLAPNYVFILKILHRSLYICNVVQLFVR